jgi:hypothetical protein
MQLKNDRFRINFDGPRILHKIHNTRPNTSSETNKFPQYSPIYSFNSFSKLKTMSSENINLPLHESKDYSYKFPYNTSHDTNNNITYIQKMSFIKNNLQNNKQLQKQNLLFNTKCNANLNKNNMVNKKYDYTEDDDENDNYTVVTDLNTVNIINDYLTDSDEDETIE